MGFMDNITSAVNRGTAAAGRETEKIRLKARMNELTKQRQGLAAQLGASLYEATREDAALRVGREALYDGIAACDAEKAECQRQIDELEAQAAASAQAADTFSCAVCGARMGGTDLFCSGCGAPADKARPAAAAAPSGRACAKCGAPLGEGDLFCMSCGARVESEDESGIGESEHVRADGDGNVTITSGGESRA